jgi:tetratricopeptide (TPR) repeat protein
MWPNRSLGRLEVFHAPNLILLRFCAYLLNSLARVLSAGRPNGLVTTNRGDRSLDFCPQEQSDQWVSLSRQAFALQAQSERSGQLGLLTEAVYLYRQALDLCLFGHPARSSLLGNLGNAMRTRFELLGDKESLAEAIEIHRQALNLRPLGNPDYGSALNDLASALHTRFEQLGDLESLAEAVELYRQALNLRPPGHPFRSSTLNNLANALWTRFQHFGGPDSLVEAIEMHREALNLRPPGHPEHSSSINNLAVALHFLYEQVGDVGSLEEALSLHRQALNLHPPGHRDRPGSLNNLANALRIRSELFRDSDSLAEAVVLFREALELLLPGHTDRPMSLNNLANALLSQYEQLGDYHLLAEAISLYRQALSLYPLGHPDHPGSINNVANALRAQFERFGHLDSLVEAINLYRQALELRPPGHPGRADSLHNLAMALRTRFQQFADIASLYEIIDLYRQALDLRPPGHPNRFGSLDSLANAMRTRYEVLGDFDSLADAVGMYREALDLCPPEHPNRSRLLSNLAAALATRFEELGNYDLLTEAVDLHRQALDLHPFEHTQQFPLLNNLAIALRALFLQSGKSNLIAEAVDLHRHALDLCPPEHTDRSRMLHNLAVALQTQVEHSGDFDSLAEVVELHRQALHLHPLGHPARLSSLKNLVTTLGTRVDQLGAMNQALIRDMNEELDLAREGLQLCTSGHPMRMWFLFAVGQCMLRTGTHLFNFEEGIHNISAGLHDRIAPATQCLGRAIRVLRFVEDAYHSLTEDEHTAEGRRQDHTNRVLEIYISTIRLIPRVASFGLDHAGRLRELYWLETVSRDAATRAIHKERITEAVEMLEEGRGVFWSQALRLRSSAVNLLPAQDAEKLRKLFQALEIEGEHSDSISAVQRERCFEERRRLSEAAEALIADIRSRPGMSRFLLPPAFSSLVQSLPDTGFVVILLTSRQGQHALVLHRHETRAKSIALNAPEGGFFSDIVQATLPRDGGSEFDFPDDTDVFRPAMISGKVKKTPRNSLDATLIQLWTLVVQPVISMLNVKVRICNVPDRSLLTHNCRRPWVLTVRVSGGVLLESLASSPFTLLTSLKTALWSPPATTSCLRIFLRFRHSPKPARIGVLCPAMRSPAFWQRVKTLHVKRHFTTSSRRSTFLWLVSNRHQRRFCSRRPRTPRRSCFGRPSRNRAHTYSISRAMASRRIMHWTVRSC